MNDEKIIDTLLKTDLKELPQAPSWADGSGLSRFNLFTPNDFVWLLNKMKNEFGIDRMKRILPTGGTGTLRNYYKQDSALYFCENRISLKRNLFKRISIYAKKQAYLFFRYW